MTPIKSDQIITKINLSQFIRFKQQLAFVLVKFQINLLPLFIVLLDSGQACVHLFTCTKFCLSLENLTCELFLTCHDFIRWRSHARTSAEENPLSCVNWLGRKFHFTTRSFSKCYLTILLAFIVSSNGK